MMGRRLLAVAIKEFRQIARDGRTLAVLLFKGGQMVDQVVGLAPKEDFKQILDKHV